MPLGILEDRKLEHVPGTSPLTQLGREAQNQVASSGINANLLKHDPTGVYILVPQPSDSPNDPYNWPKWKKEMFTVAIAYGCGCVGAVGPLLTPAFVPLAEFFNVPLQRFSLGCEGVLIALTAVSSILCNTLAVKIGKRPIYLATSVGLFVTCFWAAEAQSFASLVVARAVQGFCMGPMQALVPASIADIWFVHERGYRTAIFNLGLLGGINLASPIAGPVIQYSSFRICLHAMGGAFVIQFILTLLFMPETAFYQGRNRTVNTESRTALVAITKDGNAARSNRDLSNLEENTSEKPKSWKRELLPFDGHVHQGPFWKTLVRPFFMLASPIVLWATLLFTTCISWVVLISITISQIFSAPPYNFSVSGVGAVNLSSLAATIIGTAVAGPIVDGIVKAMSRANRGIFEPEFRLPIMVTYLIFTAVGFFAWGQSLSAHDPWPVPIVVCLGLINLGVQLGTTGVMAYVADCHREQAAEAFAAMNFIKNLFAFGMTFYANDWIAVQGVRNCFFVIGGLTVWASLLTIPMYIYGKRARGATFRYRLVSRLD